MVVCFHNLQLYQLVAEYKLCCLCLVGVIEVPVPKAGCSERHRYVDPVDVGVVGQIVEVLPGEGDVDDAGQAPKIVMEGEASRQDGVPAIVVPVLDIHDGHVDGALRDGRHARRGAVLSSHVLLLFCGQF